MNDETSSLDQIFRRDWDGQNPRVYEDVSEPARDHAHGKLPRAYPSLPNFGILYLSVLRATELIVRDMCKRNRPPFDQLLSDTPDFAEKLSKLQETLTPKIQRHLVAAIEKGRLRVVSRVSSYRNFVEHGDESQVARSYIFYGDLVNWLINSGYETSRFLAVGPAFQEYSGRSSV